MTASMKVKIESWRHGDRIPGKFAFGVPADEGHVALSENMNPAIRWHDAPSETKSFALICHDPDVPSVGNDVNQEGKTVPKDLPRVDFFHWVLVDIPSDVNGFLEGEDSTGVKAGGKSPGKLPYGLSGINNYTDWFAGNGDMKGSYGGYDGPCPPWNDSIMHHYHFTVYALDVETLGLSLPFGGPEALAAMSGHILASGSHMGTYSMNPAV